MIPIMSYGNVEQIVVGFCRLCGVGYDLLKVIEKYIIADAKKMIYIPPFYFLFSMLYFLSLYICNIY